MGEGARLVARRGGRHGAPGAGQARMSDRRAGACSARMPARRADAGPARMQAGPSPGSRPIAHAICPPGEHTVSRHVANHRHSARRVHAPAWPACQTRARRALARMLPANAREVGICQAMDGPVRRCARGWGASSDAAAAVRDIAPGERSSVRGCLSMAGARTRWQGREPDGRGGHARTREQETRARQRATRQLSRSVPGWRRRIVATDRADRATISSSNRATVRNRTTRGVPHVLRPRLPPADHADRRWRA